MLQQQGGDLQTIFGLLGAQQRLLQWGAGAGYGGSIDLGAVCEQHAYGGKLAASARHRQRWM